MKLSNVSMRVVPASLGRHAPSVHNPPAAASPAARELDVAATPLPTELTGGSLASAPPAGVSPFAWEMMLASFADAQRRSSATSTPLRKAVQAVVRELRAANQTWDHVYAVLHGVVTPAPGGQATWATEFHMHSSHSAALEAHMQSWADVERLAELEDQSDGLTV